MHHLKGGIKLNKMIYRMLKYLKGQKVKVFNRFCLCNKSWYRG